MTSQSFTLRIRVTPQSHWPDGTPNLLASCCARRRGGTGIVAEIAARMLGHVGIETLSVRRSPKRKLT